ncbi:kinase-like domain-containing protein [Spinellus fusiger]|nr:kinase-like domain-containing protein [Spinellus fusiger]
MHPTCLHNQKIDPQLLLDTYIDNNTIKIIKIIGKGAYGVVFLGQSTIDQQVYAVKWAPITKATENEITIHLQMSSHPNIIAPIQVIKEPTGVFIVFEYASEGDLFAAITKTHRLVGNNHAIRHVFLQILSAVQHCHQNGVFHRDLKPENILLFPNLHVKLADFGLATTQAVSADFDCGSTFYFSPECQRKMLNKEQKTKGYRCQQSDIWSLGIILINLVVGKNPWNEANLTDPTFKSYVEQPHYFFQYILPIISNELDDILSRIFCIDPVSRISLPELQHLISRCATFFHIDTVSNAAVPHLLPIAATTMETPPVTYTDSFRRTMLDYIGTFTDEETQNHTASTCIAKQQKVVRVFADPPPPPPTFNPPPLPKKHTMTSSNWSSGSSDSMYSSECSFALQATDIFNEAMLKKPDCTQLNLRSISSLLSLTSL